MNVLYENVESVFLQGCGHLGSKLSVYLSKVTGIISSFLCVQRTERTEPKAYQLVIVFQTK